MATCVEFIVDREEMWREIERLNELAESSRETHFIAACKIQSWFRGIATRNHIHMLNKAATGIQRIWRGYRVRKNWRENLVGRERTRQQNYDSSATRIQAAWRGYWARKNGYDINIKKKWIAAIRVKNEEIQRQMQSYRQFQQDYAKYEIEKESLMIILLILFRLHHLMGTKSRPGILTSIDEKFSTKIENMLKCLEYTLSTENERSKKDQSHNRRLDAESLITQGTRFGQAKRAIRDNQTISRKVPKCENLLAVQKSLETQVDCIAKEIWGANYRGTLCACDDSISHLRGNCHKKEKKTEP